MCGYPHPNNMYDTPSFVCPECGEDYGAFLCQVAADDARRAEQAYQDRVRTTWVRICQTYLPETHLVEPVSVDDLEF